MPFQIKCPGCGKTLEVPDSAAGKRAKCPACAQVWQVPEPAPAVPQQPAAPQASAAAIKTSCPGCGQTLQVPGTAIGKRAKCPSCGQVWVVARPAVDAEAVPDMPAAPSFRPTPSRPGMPSMPAKNEWFDDMMGDEYPIAAGQNFPGSPAASSAPSEPPRRPCPSCGEMIPVGAAKCRFCDAIFDDTLRRSRRRPDTISDYTDLTTFEWVICIGCSSIGCIVGIIYAILGRPKGMKMVKVSIIAVLAWSAFWILVNMIFGVAFHAPNHFR
jgi:hypothetical protein